MLARETFLCLKQRARFFADALEVEDRFKKRHNITYKVISGEASSVDEVVVREWTKNLKVITVNYANENIFNADETGIFWSALPNKTLATGSEAVHGI